MPSNSNPLVRNYNWSNSSYLATSTMMNAARPSVPMSYVQQNPPLGAMMMSTPNYSGNLNSNLVNCLQYIDYIYYYLNIVNLNSNHLHYYQERWNNKRHPCHQQHLQI